MKHWDSKVGQPTNGEPGSVDPEKGLLFCILVGRFSPFFQGVSERFPWPT
jgi:hypothetical protein